MSFCYLLLGTNLGNRMVNLKTAENQFSDQIGPIILKSSIYKTEAWGNKEQPYFYNRVLKINTKYTAEEVFKKSQLIEKEMGRIKTTKWGSRIIDIDILFFDNIIITTENLTIPHAAIAERRFTLEPLFEIAPNLIHPSLGKSIAKLLNECTDTLKVEKI